MDIEVVTKYKDFLLLDKLWNDLLAKTTSNMICMTHEWFKCWWHAYGENYEENQKLSILLIKEDGNYIGIVPFKTSRAIYRGFRIRKVGFIENDISPHVDFILTSNKEKAIREVISFSIDEKLGDILVLRNLMEASENVMLLQKILEQENISFGIKDGLRDPIIKTDGDWDQFFSERSAKFRKSLRYKKNKAEKILKVEVERASGIDSIKKFLPAILEISKKSWKGKIGQAISQNKMDADFYTEMSEKLGRKGWVDIWLLHSNGTPIAYEYHLKYDGIVYPIRADFDEEYAHLSPGSLLEYSIIKSLFKDPKVKQYDTCANNYKYLKNWTDIFKPHVNIDIFYPGVYSNSLYSLEYQIVAYLKHKRLAKKIINLVTK